MVGLAGFAHDLGVVTMMKIERSVNIPFVERKFAELPNKLRWALAGCRYKKQFRKLRRLQTEKVDQLSLTETEKLNTIFVHIPKAAGVSIAQSLFGSQAASHTPVFLYLALYGQQRFDEMYKFTFVRNPWDRVISAYNFLKAGGMNTFDANWAKEHLDNFSDVNDFVIRGLAHRNIKDWMHFREQAYFLIDPRTNNIGVDFVGRYENMAADFQTVREQLSVTADLKHLNRTITDKAHFRDVLVQKSIDTISDLYRRDIQLLGY